MDIKNIYQAFLEQYQQTGKKPYPDRLLALLLLSDKDKYEPLMVSVGDFYLSYKKEIDTMINKVINDFEISKEEMINYIEDKDICYREEKYEHDKVWFVFAEGISCLQGYLMYYSNLTCEQIYLLNLHCFYYEDYSESVNLISKCNKTLERKKYGC